MAVILWFNILLRFTNFIVMICDAHNYRGRVAVLQTTVLHKVKVFS